MFQGCATGLTHSPVCQLLYVWLGPANYQGLTVKRTYWWHSLRKPRHRAAGRHLLWGLTCHPTQENASHLTPAGQAGTRFTYPGGMEGWVDLVTGYIQIWFTRPLRLTHRNNTNDNVYSAVIMARSLQEFTRFMQWMQTERQVAANPQTKPTDLGCWVRL